MDPFARLEQLLEDGTLPDDILGEPLDAHTIKKMEAAARTPFPHAWKRLLQILGGRGWIAGLWTGDKPEDICPVTDYRGPDSTDEDVAPLQGLLTVGNSDEGDHWCLEVLQPGGAARDDARLARVSHETLEITEDYPSIAAFVEMFVKSIEPE